MSHTLTPTVTATVTATVNPIARVGEVPLHRADEVLNDDQLRQRACTELLRQRTMAVGLLAADDAPETDGAISQAAAEAIEALLEAELQLPEPDETACRRHHAAHAARYRVGERVQARHILYAVTPGVDINALRRVAEQTLLDLRAQPEGFAERAREQSNCPSAAEGGLLGWLERGDCAPEFAAELFGLTDVGVLPRLVQSRFGLHVVEVLARDPGRALAYELVHGAVRLALQQQAYATALRQYLRRLAAEAEVEGVALEASDSPLQQ